MGDYRGGRIEWALLQKLAGNGGGREKRGEAKVADELRTMRTALGIGRLYSLPTRS